MSSHSVDQAFHAVSEFKESLYHKASVSTSESEKREYWALADKAVKELHELQAMFSRLKEIEQAADNVGVELVPYDLDDLDEIA